MRVGGGVPLVCPFCKTTTVVLGSIGPYCKDCGARWADIPGLVMDQARLGTMPEITTSKKISWDDLLDDEPEEKDDYVDTQLEEDLAELVRATELAVYEEVAEDIALIIKDWQENGFNEGPSALVIKLGKHLGGKIGDRRKK